jgi:esterase FrsA
MHALSAILFAALLSLTSEAASAQTADRTIDEIKAETIARARTGAYPVLGIQPSDAEAALSRIKTRDPDEWAAAWSAVADDYMVKAKAASDAKEVDTSLVRAWRLYYFGQWPAPTSAGKRAAYQRAIDAYLQHARFLDPPLEVVRIPFEGSEIVGYLRLPANAPRPVPLVLAISGLDSRKETVAETYAAALPQGIGFFAVDSPGTGQAPLKAGETSERMSTKIASLCMARALGPIGQRNSRTPRPSAWRALSPNHRQSTVLSRWISSAAECTRANICSTCFRPVCSSTA